MAQKFTVPVTIKNLSSAGSDGLTVFLDQESFARLKVEAGGRITWGAGSSAGDTNLYRDEANVLKTDDTFKSAGLFVAETQIDPSAATVGDALVFNGTKFVSASVAGGGGGGASLTVSDTAPISPSVGDLWFNSSNARTYVYYDSSWVEVGASGGVATLDDIGDVTTPSPTTNDVLQWNGTAWVNVAASTVGATTLDGLSDVVITSSQNGQLLEFDGTNWVNAVRPSSEPIGHENKADSVISFNEGTRTFSIAPVSGSYTVWCAGKRYVKTGTETVQIPDTSGLYYIYFNSSGVLAYRTSYFVWDTDTPTAYIYWNEVDNKAYFFADERHGITLDWATHEYLHRTRGAVIANGFGVSNYSIDGNGSSDDHAKFDLAGGTFFDEDLQVDITHSATPTANTWEQVLEGNAEIPVFYKLNSHWVKDAATEFAFKQGASRPQYNSYSAPNWSTTDIDNNKFAISWIIATNNLNEPVIAIMGQDSYNTIGEAEAAVWEDLNLDGFPIVEFRPLHKVVFQGTDSFANSVNAAIRGIYDLRRVSSNGSAIPSTPVSDHGSMTGLLDDDHTQYLNSDRHNALDHSTAMSTVILDDVSDVSVNSPTDGQFLRYNSASTVWVNDTINLGTDTDGDYVQSLVAGTGVTLSNNSGETATPTVAIGQDVATSASVTFAQVNTTGDMVVGGNLTVNGTTTTLNTETLAIEDNIVVLNSNVTGSPATNAGIEVERGTSANVALRWNETSDKWELTEDGATYNEIATADEVSAITISILDDIGDVSASTAAAGDFLKYDGAQWVNDPINLGTDTVGNYVADVVSGTGISISHTPGEGSSASVALNAALDDLSDVTVPSPNTNDVLTYNGSVWTSASASGGSTVTASTTPPSSPEPGSIWFDSSTAKTYVYYDSFWVEIGGTSGGAKMYVDQTAPSAPLEGQLWFRSDTAQTFAYYDSFWVEVGAAGMAAIAADSAPASPVTGQIWFDTDTGATYVYYDSYWIEVGAVAANTIYNIVDAKGDILVGTADNVLDRQAVGTNGQLLQANSATTSGLEWFTPNYAPSASPTFTGVVTIPAGASISGYATLASPTFTGNVTGNPAVATTSTGTSGFGYMGLPQNASTTGAYGVVAADAGTHIYSSATRTVTIPENATIAMPVGSTIVFIAGTGATVTIAITTDTMYLAGDGTTGSRTLAPFGMATAVKITSTSWIISGNGLT